MTLVYTRNPHHHRHHHCRHHLSQKTVLQRGAGWTHCLNPWYLSCTAVTMALEGLVIVCGWAKEEECVNLCAHRYKHSMWGGDTKDRQRESQKETASVCTLLKGRGFILRKSQAKWETLSSGQRSGMVMACSGEARGKDWGGSGLGCTIAVIVTVTNKSNRFRVVYGFESGEP